MLSGKSSRESFWTRVECFTVLNALEKPREIIMTVASVLRMEDNGSGCRASREESKFISKKRRDFRIIKGLVHIFMHQLPFYESRENRFNRNRSEVGRSRRLVNFGNR